ncbi:MAG: hypothetical protein U0935_14270 [Pirellulales bacterium]
MGSRSGPERRRRARPARNRLRGWEPLEVRACPDAALPFAVTWCQANAADAVGGGEPEPPPSPVVDPTVNVLTDGEVDILLRRAAAASASDDAIIAVVDRQGRILGVRTEAGIDTSDLHELVFAIDGAVAKARTAALFASDAAPLTSRTIRNLSQSTVTQREVESNPTLPDPGDSTNNNPFDDTQPVARTFGPGFVAPIGVGGHFPAGISYTPPVDLFGIERQSRDSLLLPGADGVKGIDDIELTERFNIDPAYLAPGAALYAPESYGYESQRLPYAQARGLATLPGGIPIYKVVEGQTLPTMVGGIGVFFPGPDGYATYEQGFVHADLRPGHVPQTNDQRLNAPRVLEAEWIAYAAVGGIRFFNPTSRYGDGSVGTLAGVPPLPNFGLPFGRIDLVGITLEIFGPNPTAANRLRGFETLLVTGAAAGTGDPDSGSYQLLDAAAGNPYLRFGIAPTDGWIVTPHASPSRASELSAAEIESLILNGVAEAQRTRAAIRLDLTNIKNGLPQPGARTRMVLAVGDRDGNILGLYRMPDATMFSLDVAVAKARNTAYYASPGAVQDEDLVDDDLLWAAGVTTTAELAAQGARIDGVNNHQRDLYGDSASQLRVPAAVTPAFTNRTFRYLAEPRYPAGIDGTLPGVFSSLLTVGVNRSTAENASADPTQAPYAGNFQTVLGYDAFHVARNFRDPRQLANQNGVVFFPGSTPLYAAAGLQGGLGVSGDGVDQDDVVTYIAQTGLAAPTELRADQFFYRGVRLPFQKFNRNPSA